MLNINKNITLIGNSVIEGVSVVYMSATLNTDGTQNTTTNKTVLNQELYNANKVEIRKDLSDFENEVYKVEDEILSGNLV